MKLRYTDIVTKEYHYVDAEITTNHPASHYNIPVVVLDDGDVIGAQSWVMLQYKAVEVSAEERPLLERFLHNTRAVTAPEMGRPPIYGEPMRQTTIFLPIPMHNWLKARAVPMSVFVRDLLAEEMKKDKRIEDPQKKAIK